MTNPVRNRILGVLLGTAGVLGVACLVTHQAADYRVESARARAEGARAGQAAVPVEACPCRDGNSLRGEWLRGYADGFGRRTGAKP